MKFTNFFIILFVFVLSLISCNDKKQKNTAIKIEDMMIRIAELEIDPNYLDEYLAILKEESEVSVRLEPGVICIFPMFITEHTNQIRLLEIYANREAYESHLKTPHFLAYKTSTLEMVKSLRLVDMSAIDAATMQQIFSKIKE